MINHVLKKVARQIANRLGLRVGDLRFELPGQGSEEIWLRGHMFLVKGDVAHYRVVFTLHDDKTWCFDAVTPLLTAEKATTLFTDRERQYASPTASATT